MTTVSVRVKGALLLPHVVHTCEEPVRYDPHKLTDVGAVAAAECRAAHLSVPWVAQTQSRTAGKPSFGKLARLGDFKAPG